MISEEVHPLPRMLPIDMLTSLTKPAGPDLYNLFCCRNWNWKTKDIKKTEIKQDPQGCDSLKKRNLVDEKTLCFVVGGFAMGTTVALGDLPVPCSSDEFFFNCRSYLSCVTSFTWWSLCPGSWAQWGRSWSRTSSGHQHLGRLSQRLHLCKPCLSFANPSVEGKERAAHWKKEMFDESRCRSRPE